MMGNNGEILGLVIYFLGYVVSYYYFRFLFKMGGHDWNWNLVFTNLIISLVSWITVICVLIIHIIDICQKRKIKIKVPKWL
jgi:hypothetical protein